MRMTHALVAMLVFSVLLIAGGFETVGTRILTALNVFSTSGWTLVTLGGVGILTLAATYLSRGNILTAPAITAMIALVTIPMGVFDATIPLVVRALVSGIWLFIGISGVGGAIRGDF